MTNFSNNLKLLRKEENLSQQTLATKIGVTQSSIAKWESGEREPNFEILIRIAKFFKISTDFLLGIED